MEGIKKAIDIYGYKEGYEAKIYDISINQLNLEFGDDFDIKLLNQAWDGLLLTRCGIEIMLGPIIWNGNEQKEFLDKIQYNKEWWIYLKKLIYIFQSDPRTRY